MLIRKSSLIENRTLRNTSHSRCLQSVSPTHSEMMTSLPHLPQVCTPRSGVFLHSSLGVGCAVAWDGDFKEQTEGDSFSNVLDLFLNCASFIYIGAWLPFDQFRIPELGITPWRLVLLMLVILALRRIPFLLVLYKFLPEVENWRDALLCGHFGPVGSLRSTKSSTQLILCSRLASVPSSSVIMPKPASRYRVTHRYRNKIYLPLRSSLSSPSSSLALSLFVCRPLSVFEDANPCSQFFRWPFHSVLFDRPSHLSLASWCIPEE